MILFVNFFAYLVWAYLTIRKEKRLTVYSLMIIFICVVAFLGYYTVQTGIYFDTFGRKDINRLTYTPYVLSFITYYILFYPLKKMKFVFSDEKYLSGRLFKIAIKYWSIIFFLYALLKLYEAYSTLQSGLGEAYELRHMDGETLYSYNNVFIFKFNGYCEFLLEATVPLVMYYVFMGLHKGFIKIKYALYLITLSIAPSFLTAIGQGSRGGMFMAFFCFLFFLIGYWHFIPKYAKRKLVELIIFSLLLGCLISWIITMERVSSGGGSIDSILRYFGEPFPNLGFNFYDKVIVHPMGARFFPNFFMNTSYSLWGSVKEMHDYWWFITGVPVLNFCTYFGDLYVEFGTMIALLFVSTTTTIMLFITKQSNYLKGAILPISFFYYKLCVFSFAHMTKTGHYAVFQLWIILLISSIYFIYCMKKNKNSFI